MTPAKSPLYLTLAGLIVPIVVMIMALKATFDYQTTKAQLVAEMKQRSSASISALQSNTAGLIEAYAVNEYAKLVQTEMEQRDYFAVIIEDYNMGEILGSGAFVSGKIRLLDGAITDYNPDSAEHKRRLADCYYHAGGLITSADGRKLGMVTIHISDRAIRAELDKIISATLVSATTISLLLIVSLFVSIRHFVVKPLGTIVSGIERGDVDGIPREPIAEQGPREIRKLACTMNRMIDSITDSRTALQEQQQQLAEEKQRFQLAIEGTRDGLWDWDLQTDKVIHSARFETMLGYEEGELPDTIECWTGLLHPDDAQQAYENVEEYLKGKGKGVYENTFRMRTKAGQWRWITGRGKALFAEDGTPLRFVGFNTDVTEQVRHQEQLEHSAKHDSLTGLPNRFLFNELIQKAMQHCRRSDRQLALLYIDLDGFKEINDSYGHDMGDTVLVSVARRMEAVIRQEDVVARLGGDEFVIAVAGISHFDEVESLLQRLLSDLRQPVFADPVDGTDMHVSASIGVTLYPQQEEIGPDALLRQADQAMYRAKLLGKNRYFLYDD